MQKMIGILIAVVLVGGGIWYFLFASSDQKRNVQMQGQLITDDVKSTAGKLSGTGHSLAGTPSGDKIALAKVCRENLKRIESAKRAVAKRKSIAAGSVSLQDVLAQLAVKSLPKCPAGGEYTIMPVGTMVRCSIGSCGTVDKQDDHFIIGLCT